ncbi:MAG: rhodanese-like domain-containing protein [Planctomycetota bacterium]|nr:rhodanese-like domain-containing protein [Planctomycetota bacterium]
MSGPIDTTGLPAEYPFRPEYELTPRQVMEMRRANPQSILIIDVRTQPEWDLVHVDGAEHIPLDDIERRASEVQPEPGQVVATLCHHGVRSLKASLALRQLGVSGAMSIAGGIDSWSLGADASVARYERQGGRCWKI